MYNEKDFIQLSSIQHYRFCKRQFYLSYVEDIWIENYLTASGRVMHKHVDDVHKEKRKNVVQEFGLSICSYDLGISGKADVIEFYFDDSGAISKIIPIEYKRGQEKDNNCDELQLCAQTICLEEMMNMRIDSGFLFYGKERRRKEINFTTELRNETVEIYKEIHSMYSLESKPPGAVYFSGCKACSFLDYCKPKTIGKKKSARKYFNKIISGVTFE